MIVIPRVGLSHRDVQNDIISDLRRLTKSAGIVNLKQVRQFLSKYWGLEDSCEVADILRQAVKRGALRPARPLWAHWYAPKEPMEKREADS